MAGAKKSVHVLLYQMGAGPILDGLVAAARGGLEVRVILDVSQKPVNERFKTQLEAAGAQVIWSDPQFSFMHAKVLIVDKSVAVVSTGNYAATQLDAERNYVMTDTDAHDVEALGSLFAADFGRTAPDLSARACSSRRSTHASESSRSSPRRRRSCSSSRCSWPMRRSAKRSLHARTPA